MQNKDNKNASVIEKIMTQADEIDVPSNDNNRFNVIYQKMMNARWHITIITLIILLFLIVGIFAGILVNVTIAQTWKEILLLMLGVFSGSFNRIIDYWFNNGQRDDKLIEKVDDENDTAATLKLKALKHTQNAAPVAPAQEEKDKK